MSAVLFDTNVILDVLLERQPFYEASALALNTAVGGAVEGYIAAHAVTTVAYLLQRRLGATRTRVALVNLLSHLRVAPRRRGSTANIPTGGH
ncbi:MAG: PIN domain-containing protein [Aphanocapsa lilacina HA4352-LM1]|jgi:predicted nucleic acid-binding protein|nr:PIN domain-containing protein [Aphanocapsa lilacina HA4352-LM1]